MKRLGYVLALAVAASASACRGSATAPTVLDVNGTWTGTETDRLGPALLTWQLVQTGYVLSGTVTMRPVDPADGSCGSCHKSKVGTVSGTVSERTIMISMFFPAGAEGDPTPACSIKLNSTAPTVTAAGMTGTYVGSDPCEGTFDGTMTMTRRP